MELRWSGTEQGTAWRRIFSRASSATESMLSLSTRWRSHNSDPHNCGITLEKPVDPLAINIQYLRKSTYLRGQPISGRPQLSAKRRKNTLTQEQLDESSGDEAIDLDYKTGGFHFKDHEIKGRKSAANTAL
ncbi:unnamed protein product [Microthlaspi erraticum]|uniref:Uncharacterized protein n=1 Tax=Microthlaspi erraticum TaxID=1685480 RepID=A0A6D2KAU1_9BRAS|nr:unnamed protein product [Microthlaspi erraticum]